MNSPGIVPLSLASPLAPSERIADLERRVVELERITTAMYERIAGLVARCDSATAQPSRPHPTTVQADSERLREAIRGILATHEGFRQLTRKEVLRELEHKDLGRDKLPVLSTVGWHIREIRKEQPVNVNAAH